MTKTTHTVKRGETITKIAKRYKVTPDNIVRWNKLPNRNLIYEDQDLTIYTNYHNEDRFEICIARVLKHEGGQVDHKADKGGKTNYGISQYIFKVMQRDELTTATDVYDITEAQAKCAYRKYFWDCYKIGNLPKGFDYYYLDLYINHSPATVQKITANTEKMIDIKENRDNHYRLLVENDPTQKVFLNGWLNRSEDVYKMALSEL